MANGQHDGFDVFLSFARAPDGACPAAELIRGTLAQIEPSGLDIRSSEPLDEGMATGTPENAAVFVAVVSDDYLGSAQAVEGARFDRAARKRDSTGEPPIFLLVETPVAIPEYLQGAAGKYEAFGEDSAPTEALLRTACTNLVMQVLSALPSPEEDVPAAAQKKVFLAHTHKSLFGERKQLLNELVSHGFAVAPQADAAATPEQILEATTRLAEADVSVHLLNSAYDEAAADEAVAAAGKTRRLVWLEPESDPHNSTMKELFADVKGAEGTTPYENSLEEFRKHLLRELGERAGTPVAEQAPIEPPASKDLLDIYVHYESSDAKETQRVVDFLDRLDCVTYPTMYGPETDTSERAKHYETAMSICHAVLVVAGHAPFPSWLQSIRIENRKGWPSRPIACCYFDPLDQAKQEFKAKDVIRIVAGSGLSPEAQTALRQFIDEVRRTRTAPLQ